ncbi:unnamed protein product [Amoebophrya sp. A25]|nr:unnamed protein product [Amoebophrya sp. A25]|eukprot:GSA25T00002994001.1
MVGTIEEGAFSVRHWRDESVEEDGLSSTAKRRKVEGESEQADIVGNNPFSCSGLDCDELARLVSSAFDVDHDGGASEVVDFATGGGPQDPSSSSSASTGVEGDPITGTTGRSSSSRPPPPQLSSSCSSSEEKIRALMEHAGSPRTQDESCSTSACASGTKEFDPSALPDVAVESPLLSDPDDLELQVDIGNLLGSYEYGGSCSSSTMCAGVGVLVGDDHLVVGGAGTRTNGTNNTASTTSGRGGGLVDVDHSSALEEALGAVVGEDDAAGLQSILQDMYETTGGGTLTKGYVVRNAGDEQLLDEVDVEDLLLMNNKRTTTSTSTRTLHLGGGAEVLDGGDHVGSTMKSAAPRLSCSGGTAQSKSSDQLISFKLNPKQGRSPKKQDSKQSCTSATGDVINNKFATSAAASAVLQAALSNIGDPSATAAVCSTSATTAPAGASSPTTVAAVTSTTSSSSDLLTSTTCGAATSSASSSTAAAATSKHKTKFSPEERSRLTAAWEPKLGFQDNVLCVSMGGQGLTDEHIHLWTKWMDGIVKGLIKNRGKLRNCSLDFARNKISSAGLQRLCHLFKKHSMHVRELNLGRNLVTDEGLTEKGGLVDWLKGMAGPIHTLRLEGNQLTASGVIILGEAIRGLTLHYPRWNERSRCHESMSLSLSQNPVTNLWSELKERGLAYCLTEPERVHKVPHNTPIFFFPDLTEDVESAKLSDGLNPQLVQRIFQEPLGGGGLGALDQTTRAVEDLINELGSEIVENDLFAGMESEQIPFDFPLPGGLDFPPMMKGKGKKGGKSLQMGETIGPPPGKKGFYPGKRGPGALIGPPPQRTTTGGTIRITTTTGEGVVPAGRSSSSKLDAYASSTTGGTSTSASSPILGFPIFGNASTAGGRRITAPPGRRSFASASSGEDNHVAGQHLQRQDQSTSSTSSSKETAAGRQWSTRPPTAASLIAPVTSFAIRNQNQKEASKLYPPSTSCAAKDELGITKADEVDYDELFYSSGAASPTSCSTTVPSSISLPHIHVLGNTSKSVSVSAQSSKNTTNCRSVEEQKQTGVLVVPSSYSSGTSAGATDRCKRGTSCNAGTTSSCTSTIIGAPGSTTCSTSGATDTRKGRAPVSGTVPEQANTPVTGDNRGGFGPLPIDIKRTLAREHVNHETFAVDEESLQFLPSIDKSSARKHNGSQRIATVVIRGATSGSHVAGGGGGAGGKAPDDHARYHGGNHSYSMKGGTSCTNKSMKLQISSIVSAPEGVTTSSANHHKLKNIASSSSTSGGMSATSRGSAGAKKRFGKGRGGQQSIAVKKSQPGGNVRGSSGAAGGSITTVLPPPRRGGRAAPSSGGQQLPPPMPPIFFELPAGQTSASAGDKSASADDKMKSSDKNHHNKYNNTSEEEDLQDENDDVQSEVLYDHDEALSDQEEAQEEDDADAEVEDLDQYDLGLLSEIVQDAVENGAGDYAAVATSKSKTTPAEPVDHKKTTSNADATDEVFDLLMGLEELQAWVGEDVSMSEEEE